MRVFVAVLVVGGIGCASASDSNRNGAFDAALPDTPDACVALAESCNDLDDDCDTKIDEDFADKGMPCTLGVGACAAAGTWTCDGNGALVCDAQMGVASAEQCDGIDNDCDGMTDEDFHIGSACDGPDADHCAEGMIVCDGPSATRCTDGPDDSIESCDNIDNDCDGHVDEGFGVGTPCDGADADACNEGMIVCDGHGGTMCGDTTGDNVELCNGLDDDCRNGVDDPYPVGQACAVGLGACARSGSLVCNAAQTGVACSASPGAPTAELCGNSVDEDCNGADAACPGNDLPAGAIDISAGGTFSVDLSAAHDDNFSASTPTEDCGDQGGRDVFYTFTLPAPEVVYFDTFGSNFDTVVRVFAGACPSIGALQRCEDDACASTRSQGALQLAAGQYCLVVDQFSNTVTPGAATLHFLRGGRTGSEIAGAGSVAGNTTGKADLSVASCEANSHQPEDAYFFLSCPSVTTFVDANTCSLTSFDTVLYVRSGSAATGDVACDDDTAGCGSFDSKLVNVGVGGPNLNWVIVDGFGTGGHGAYTLQFNVH